MCWPSLLILLQILIVLAIDGTANSDGTAVDKKYEDLVLKISRATAVILLFAFCLYVWFQMRTHHSLFDAVLELEDTKDKEADEVKSSKLTMTECLVALALSLTLVAVHAVFLGEWHYSLTSPICTDLASVRGIEPLVQEEGLSNMFMGLILVPLVGTFCLTVTRAQLRLIVAIEKLAEHLGAVDEAYENRVWNHLSKLDQTKSAYRISSDELCPFPRPGLYPSNCPPQFFAGGYCRVDNKQRHGTTEPLTSILIH